MKRSIAALTIALMISAGTEAEAQTGMTVETVYLYLTEEDFELEESADDHYHIAWYKVPEITWAVWDEGTVIVHKCQVKESFDRMAKIAQGYTGSIDAEPYDKPGHCEALMDDESYGFTPFNLDFTYDREGSADRTAGQARFDIRLYIAAYPLLRVTIIAPAE